MRIPLYYTKLALPPVFFILVNVRPVPQFSKPTSLEPWTAFSHSKQHTLFILLLLLSPVWRGGGGGHLSTWLGPSTPLSTAIQSLTFLPRNFHLQPPLLPLEAQSSNTKIWLLLLSCLRLFISISWLIAHNLKSSVRLETPIHIFPSSGKFSRTDWTVLS